MPKGTFYKDLYDEIGGYSTPQTRALLLKAQNFDNNIIKGRPARPARPTTYMAKGGKVQDNKKGDKLTKKYIEKARTKPGGSNVGKKKFASGKKRTGPYVGPSGDAPKGSYPIPDKKHAKAALALAHNAPNPEGIKKAVYKKYPEFKKK